MFLKRENNRLVANIFGIKMKFKNIFFDQLKDMCCIENLEYFRQQETEFPHPMGIVIHPNVTVGKHCKIFQNVTIGGPKHGKLPKLGDNVIVYPNSCIIGDIIIGNGAVIGAGSVVVDDIPANAIAAGNPAKVIKTKK